jgi:hypothetical protein
MQKSSACWPSLRYGTREWYDHPYAVAEESRTPHASVRVPKRHTFDVRGEAVWSACRCPQCGSHLLTDGVALWCSHVGGIDWRTGAYVRGCDYGLRERVTYNTYQPRQAPQPGHTEG